MKRLLVIGLLLVMALPLAALAQSSATIKIVKPGDRRNVELTEIPVEVKVEGVALSEGYRWQILIDGVPQGMVHDTLTTKIVVPKPTGPHRLKAELYDANGAVVATHDILVMAAPVENHEPLFNRAWYVPAMGLLSLATVGFVLLGLRLRPRTTT